MMNFEIELPEWANWVAQDSDGNWFAYYQKPVAKIRCWNKLPDWTLLMGAGADGKKIFRHLCKGTKPNNFKSEIYQVIR